MANDGSWLLMLGIPLIALICGAALATGVGFAFGKSDGAERKRFSSKASIVAILGVASWFGATAFAARSGALARFDSRPPPFALLILATLVIGAGLGFSRIGDRLSRLPLGALVLAQGVRLPLELVMHQAAREGVMPPQMSFSGLNFDIVTGALAIPLAWAIARGKASRWLIRAWNYLGFGTLFIVLTIAVTSTPVVHAFGSDAAHLNTWVAYFPYVWLVAGPVLMALTGHIVVLRALRHEACDQTAATDALGVDPDQANAPRRIR